MDERRDCELAAAAAATVKLLKWLASADETRATGRSGH